MHGCQAIGSQPKNVPADLMLLCNACFESNIGNALKETDRSQMPGRFRPRRFGQRRFGHVTRRLNVAFLHVAVVTAGLALASLSGASAYKAQSAAIPAGAPLSFGMSTDEASAALGVPLSYVRGRPGNELLLALPNVKGSALTIRSDGLYLQFRSGRLTGWKGDWGTAKPLVVGW
jgi:hypothetical protein